MKYTIVFVIIIALGWLLYSNLATQEEVDIPTEDNNQVVYSNFTECVSAGEPVLESYPRKCGGYVEDIGNELELVDQIRSDNPRPNQQISSPLNISGQAIGPWYFEAIFSIELLDANNLVLAETAAEAQSSWMTTNFVPYQATLNYATPTTATGSLILHKANPSGEPQNDAQLVIPVVF